MLDLSQLTGFNSVIEAPPTIEFLTYTGVPSPYLSAKNVAVNLGTPTPGRLIVVILAGHDGTTNDISSTVMVGTDSRGDGGVLCDVVKLFSPDQRLPIGMFVVEEDTLSSTYIKVQIGIGCDAATLAVYAIHGAKSKTPVLVGFDDTVPLEVAVGGESINAATIACAGRWLSQTPSWSSPLVQDFAHTPQGVVTGAHVNPQAPFTANPGFTAGGYGADNLIVASWR